MASLQTRPDSGLKQAVKDFWDDAPCGEVYASGDTLKKQFDAHSKMRYALEPYIFSFAQFETGKNKTVLEIGVGMGADHLEWAKACPKRLTGIDLTPHAVEYTKKRLETYGYSPDCWVGDAENLPFSDKEFDIVYSWGVIHHSPDTLKAIQEIYRVLKPGGIARIMIYHYYSIVGYMLWLRYALLRMKPFLPLSDIYFNFLESPGTKAFTVSQAKEMCSMFSSVNVGVQLGFGDLLLGNVGQRHQGLMLSFAKKIWPRWFIKHFLAKHGLGLFINAMK
jgi:ubiquinone/menaquinone biosynthesis C-methylase UbiE